MVADGLGDEARRDRRAVVMHDRHQPHRIDTELVDDQRPQLAVAVLLDHIDEVMLGDKARHAGMEREGAKPQPVATVSLQLKKTDPKRGKFTLTVTSDDKTIEKKDRNIAEPIQFYSGRSHLLFELVIWTAEKNKATGYLSTPKNAPVPVTASKN